MKKYLIGLTLILTIISLLALVNVTLEASEYQEYYFSETELQEIHELEQTGMTPYRRTFEDPKEAEIYQIKLENYFESQTNERALHEGVHQVTDDAGNQYYYKDNDDLGNPSSGGYGDFRVYYKNGSTSSFDYNGVTVIDTVFFITVKNPKYGVEYGEVLMCLEPLTHEEWITSNNYNDNIYSTFSDSKKMAINNQVSYTHKLYAETGNMDYLVAGQLMVWEEVGATKMALPPSLMPEYDTIKAEIDSHNTIPSFMALNNSSTTPNYTLTYSNVNKRYEVMLHDDNNVLDSRYLNDLVGTYGAYHVEDGSGDNNLLVWVDASVGNTSPSGVIESTYNPLISSGNTLGIYYSDSPKYIDGGQDLVTGVSNPITAKVQFDVKVAYGSVELVKVGDSSSAINGNNTNYNLSGVEFTLYKTDGTKVKVDTTDSNGYLKFDDVPIGDYYVQETKAPTGYIIDTTKYYFSIDSDGKNVKINNGSDIVNNMITGRVELKKVGETTDMFSDEVVNLAGTEFIIYDKSNKQVETLTTDQNGYAISSPLIYGEYKICEMTPTEGYVNRGYCETFKINSDGQVIKLNNNKPINNEVIKGQVEVTKVGITNTPYSDEVVGLEGTEFTIYDEANNVVEILSTDANGYARSSDLKYGHYKICETMPTWGYESSGYCEEFDITYDKQLYELNSGQDVYNQVMYGKILLNKDGEVQDNFDDSFIPLEDAKFGIYWDQNKNGIIDNYENEPIEVLTTNEYGYAESDTLKSGYYIVKEIEAPSGWTNSNYTEQVVIDDQFEVIALNNGQDIENYASTGQIELNKVGYDRVNDIYETNVVYVDVNDNGIIDYDVDLLVSYATDDMLESLYSDPKHITEVETTNGYYPIEDVKFDIYQDLNNNYIIDESDLFIETLTTDANGYAISQELKFGQYIVKEQTPVGYVENEEEYVINVDEDEMVYHLDDNKVVENELIYGYLELYKVDDVNKELYLPGAEFTIYEDVNSNGLIDEEDILVDTIVTDENGYAISNELLYGDYLVTETKAPEGYVLNNEVYSFSISNNYEVVTMKISNKLEEVITVLVNTGLSTKPLVVGVSMIFISILVLVRMVYVKRA